MSLVNRDVNKQLCMPGHCSRARPVSRPSREPATRDQTRGGLDTRWTRDKASKRRLSPTRQRCGCAAWPQPAHPLGRRLHPPKSLLLLARFRSLSTGTILASLFPSSCAQFTADVQKLGGRGGGQLEKVRRYQHRDSSWGETSVIGADSSFAHTPNR